MTIGIHIINEKSPKAVVTPFNGFRMNPVSVSAVSMSTGKTESIDLRNEAMAELLRRGELR